MHARTASVANFSVQKKGHSIMSFNTFYLESKNCFQEFHTEKKKFLLFEVFLNSKVNVKSVKHQRGIWELIVRYFSDGNSCGESITFFLVPMIFIRLLLICDKPKVQKRLVITSWFSNSYSPTTVSLNFFSWLKYEIVQFCEKNSEIEFSSTFTKKFQSSVLWEPK